MLETASPHQAERRAGGGCVGIWGTGHGVGARGAHAGHTSRGRWGSEPARSRAPPCRCRCRGAVGPFKSGGGRGAALVPAAVPAPGGCPPGTAPTGKGRAPGAEAVRWVPGMPCGYRTGRRSRSPGRAVRPSAGTAGFGGSGSGRGGTGAEAWGCSGSGGVGWARRGRPRTHRRAAAAWAPHGNGGGTAGHGAARLREVSGERGRALRVSGTRQAAHGPRSTQPWAGAAAALGAAARHRQGLIRATCALFELDNAY